MISEIIFAPTTCTPPPAIFVDQAELLRVIQTGFCQWMNRPPSRSAVRHALHRSSIREEVESWVKIKNPKRGSAVPGLDAGFG